MLEKIIPDSEGKKLNVLGDNQLIKLTGLDTNGQLTVVTQDKTTHPIHKSQSMCTLTKTKYIKFSKVR